MLKKRKVASQNAAKEFAEAKRQDLKEKEDKQVEILDEYAGTVQMMAEEDLKAAVKAVVDAMAGGTNQGKVMKELLRPGGALDGKMVDKAQLASVVKDSLSGS